MTTAPASTMSIATIDAFADAVAVWLADFEPATMSGTTAAEYVESAGRVDRLMQALIAVAAKRIDDTAAFKADGSYSAAQAVARELGSSVAQVKQAIDTAAKLEWLPDTRDALLSGSLSVAQASAIAQGALAAPDAEASLLETAKSESLQKLRKQANEVALRAHADDDAEARRHTNRRIARHEAADGMTRLDGLLPNLMAGEIVSVWDCFTDRAFRAAQQAGRRESHDAYAADGLLLMARAAKAATVPGNTLKLEAIRPHFVIRVDAAPFKTGRVEVGEVCEVPGIGPVDLTAARRRLPEAIIDIIVRDGVDVKTIAHPGRRANARQLAVLLSQPYECATDGCNASEHLQIDHIVEYGKSKRTCATELGYKCGHCHHLKTHKHWRDGPKQPNGTRALIPPDKPPPTGRAP
jgi:hypothetical protein